jgi:PhzF family phenazine biosynthesis protein
MSVPLYQVDAFTDRPFAGNPAAVCLLDAPRDAAWMQRVAAEMNLSETAVLYRDGEAYRLRWFTPKVEVSLCGHATLASAHILWQRGDVPPTAPIRFETLSGGLAAARRGEWIELDFPAKLEEPADRPEGLVEALGAKPGYIGRNQFDYLVALESERAVRELVPDLEMLGGLPVRGVIVTAAGSGADCLASPRGWRRTPSPVPRLLSGAVLGPAWEKRWWATRPRARRQVRVRVRGDRVAWAGAP